MVRIRCPSCKATFETGVAGGTVVGCPQCEARVRVPKTADSQERPTVKALVRCPKCRQVLNSPSRSAVVICPTCNIRIKPKLGDSDTDSRKSPAGDSGVKMDCPKCGRPLAVSARDGSAVCRNCGVKLRMRLEEESKSDSDAPRRSAGPDGSRSGKIRITSIVTPSGRNKTVRSRSPSAAALNPMTESFLEKMDDLASPGSPDDSLLIDTRQVTTSGQHPAVVEREGPAPRGVSIITILVCLVILLAVLGGVAAGLMTGVIPWPEWLPKPE